MGQRSFIVLGVMAVITAVMSCTRVPDYVIKPDDMAELMADVRMADAVVSVRRAEYSDDASKIALKNAVLKHHGVTQEKFDTSLVWYGQNVGVYQEVTQKSIDILEKRLKLANAQASGEASISVSGDSVDIWELPRVFVFNDRSPSDYIGFSFDSDQNWERGDIYTLHSRMVSPAQNARWNVTAVYDDGAIETITSNISLDNPARQEITLVTDSTRTATNVSGWILIEPAPGRHVIVDSIGLLRRRSEPSAGITRKYSQKLILPKKDERNDTISK